MALTTIYPNGTSTVNVPATESIAISNYGGGIASIYYLVENANRPDAFQFQQTLENAGVVLGAFADGKTVKIEAGGSTVVFDVGASPDTGIGDADTLNGLPSDTGDTADTIAARDSNGDITANAFESTVTTGTAPLTVASTTVVSNLNADLLDGAEGAAYVHRDGTETITGPKEFSANTTFSANVGIGTPVKSTHALFISGESFVDHGSGGSTDGGAFRFATNTSSSFIGSNQYYTSPSTKLARDGASSIIDLDTTTGATAGDVTVYTTPSGTADSAPSFTERFRIKEAGEVQVATGPLKVAGNEVWDAGDNPSLGAGNGITGSFTTVDGKTITVTDGIITAIV